VASVKATPCWSASTASDLATPTTAHLIELEAASGTKGRMLAPDETLLITLRPRATIAG
jgi:hypothetical protein